jgi:hypothetical protein
MTSAQGEALKGEIVAAPVKALVSPEQAAAEWARFEALKAKLLVDDDYQAIAGKRYIKRSGFRKIAVYFGLSDRILEQERTDRDNGSFTWRIVVEVQAPNGRVCSGVGICDSRERSFAHVEHDVYSTAHTRAKSRAISDMVAGGAVSAEEVEAGPSEAQPEAGVAFVDQQAVIDILEKAGLDTTALTIYPDSGKMMVKPLQYLGDSWRKYDQALAGMGFKWISAAKESHWEVGVGGPI